jgi:hypothetical protein
MKSLILVTTLAALSVLTVAPLQAATTAPVLTLDSHGQIDRRGRGTDSARDKTERPGVTHP